MQTFQQHISTEATAPPPGTVALPVHGLDISISLVDLLVLTLVSLVLISILISLIIS